MKTIYLTESQARKIVNLKEGLIKDEFPTDLFNPYTKDNKIDIYGESGELSRYGEKVVKKGNKIEIYFQFGKNGQGITKELSVIGDKLKKLSEKYHLFLDNPHFDVTDDVYDFKVCGIKKDNKLDEGAWGVKPEQSDSYLDLSHSLGEAVIGVLSKELPKVVNKPENNDGNIYYWLGLMLDMLKVRAFDESWLYCAKDGEKSGNKYKMVRDLFKVANKGYDYLLTDTAKENRQGWRDFGEYKKHLDKMHDEFKKLEVYYNMDEDGPKGADELIREGKKRKKKKSAKLSKPIGAMAQVGNRVNAGIMDGIAFGGMCEERGMANADSDIDEINKLINVVINYIPRVIDEKNIVHREYDANAEIRAFRRDVGKRMVDNTREILLSKNGGITRPLAKTFYKAQLPNYITKDKFTNFSNLKVIFSVVNFEIPSRDEIIAKYGDSVDYKEWNSEKEFEDYISSLNLPQATGGARGGQFTATNDKGEEFSWYSKIVNNKANWLELQLSRIACVNKKPINIDSLPGIIYHEMSHENANYHTLDITRGKGFRTDNTNYRLNQHATMLLNSGNKLEMAIGSLLYVLFVPTELDAHAAQVYGDLQNMNSERANFEEDLRNTNAYKEYMLAKNGLEYLQKIMGGGDKSEISSANFALSRVPGLGELNYSYNRNGEHIERPSVLHNKENKLKVFIDKSKILLDKLFKKMGKVASLYYDKKEGAEVQAQQLSESKNIMPKDKYKEYMKDIAEFMEDNGLKVKPYPTVQFDDSEQDGLFIKTGHYEPGPKKIVLFISERHPKDILRSFAHEMVHHAQNLRGEDLGFTSEDDVKDNKRLEKLEAEAYLKGNLMFRKWTEHARKKQNLNESVNRATEARIRSVVKAMMANGELPKDYDGQPVEMAEHYVKILNRAFGGKYEYKPEEDDAIYDAIIDDEFKKNGGHSDMDNCLNRIKSIENSLAKIVDEAVEEKINPNDISLKSFRIKRHLNPRFWVEGHLDSRVRMKLLDIADAFIDFIGIDWVKPKDIVMTGSLANYNWSKKYSDIDLHILMNYSDIDDNPVLVDNYLYSQKELWNKEHEGINIFGFPVECFVENAESDDSVESGVYSLEKDKWIEKPDRDNLASHSMDKKSIRKLVAHYINEIDELEFLYKEVEGDEYKEKCLYVKACELWKEISTLRKKGFKEDQNEMNTGNLVFKALRRRDYIGKITKIKANLYNKLKSLNENDK